MISRDVCMLTFKTHEHGIMYDLDSTLSVERMHSLCVILLMCDIFLKNLATDFNEHVGPGQPR